MPYQYHVHQVVSSFNRLLKKPKDTENVILSEALHRMVYRAKRRISLFQGLETLRFVQGDEWGFFQQAVKA